MGDMCGTIILYSYTHFHPAAAGLIYKIFADNRNVAIKVRDENGDVIPGAQVVITRNGSTTAPGTANSGGRVTLTYNQGNSRTYTVTASCDGHTTGQYSLSMTRTGVSLSCFKFSTKSSNCDPVRFVLTFYRNMVQW